MPKSLVFPALLMVSSLGAASAGASELGAAVQVTGIFAVSPLENFPATTTNVISNAGAVFNTVPDGGTFITFTPSQIILSNQQNGTFCTIQMVLPCPDSFIGFRFTYSNTNAVINGVSVDPSTAADFRPTSLTYTANSVLLNVVNDHPALNDNLVLDLSFAPTGTTPEPSSLILLATGLLSASSIAFGRRRKA